MNNNFWTLVDRAKRLSKVISKTQGLPYGKALHETSRRLGFKSWEEFKDAEFNLDIEFFHKRVTEEFGKAKVAK